MRVLILLLALIASPAAAELYQCADASGATVLTDDPRRCVGAPAVKRPSEAPATPAPPAARNPSPAARPPSARGSDLLLSSQDVAGRWEVLNDVPDGPDRDPDLRGWGVVERSARHYTRDEADGVQVCSLEVWRFGAAASAQRAGQSFQMPGWRIDRHGDVLVMVHALTPGAPDRKRIFSDCLALRDRVARRAEQAARVLP